MYVEIWIPNVDPTHLAWLGHILFPGFDKDGPYWSMPFVIAKLGEFS